MERIVYRTQIVDIGNICRILRQKTKPKYRVPVRAFGQAAEASDAATRLEETAKSGGQEEYAERLKQDRMRASVAEERAAKLEAELEDALNKASAGGGGGGGDGGVGEAKLRRTLKGAQKEARAHEATSNDRYMRYAIQSWYLRVF